MPCLKFPGCLRITALAALLLLPVQAFLFAQDEPLTITDVQLSNYGGNNFVVTWRTNQPTNQNELLLGKSPGQLSTVLKDSLAAPNQIHFVQVSFLDINTTYFYKVRSDGVEKAASPTGVDSIRTVQQTLIDPGAILEGNVVNAITRKPIQNIIVRSFFRWTRLVGGVTQVDSTMWYAVLTNQDGKFSMNIANYRRYGGGKPSYFPGQTYLHLWILGFGKEEVRDSVLLSVQNELGRFQLLNTYEIIDPRFRANRGIITTTGPVLSNGRSASVVTVTVLDIDDKPISGVDIRLNATPDRGVRIRQPQVPTNARGQTWGLVYSAVSEIKTVRARNYSAPDSTELDTLADIEFIPELNAPLARDTVPPFIYFATQYPTTTNNAGPYPITASVVDNYTVDVKLLWGTKANIFADTLAMLPVADQLKDDYLANIPGQPFNTIVSYFILARDGAGKVSSKPDSIHSNPFVPPYLFEVLSDISKIVPNLGITLTTDATNTVNSLLPVRIDTWITSNIKIFSVLLKWRNVNESSTYSDIPFNRFGAHYWGEIPPRQPGSRIEYFVQVADTTGKAETDPRTAPNKVFDYEVLTNGALGPVSFADTTSRLGLPIARSSRYSAIADFNEDGILDVVIANYGEANEVYFYNRALGFEDVSLNVLGPQSAEKTTFVAVADFNADDHLDLIFANEDSQNRLYINNGRGRFEDKTFALVDTTGKTYLPADNWGTRCILADDFDGNGTIDLFLANFKIGGERNRLLLNNGKGIFTDATTTKIFNMPDRDQSVWAVKGDLDKDGDVDVIVINQPDKPYLLINSGNGTLQYRAWSATAGNYARGGDLGDIDSDGDLDLVIFQSQTTHNELYINDGKGNFTLDRAGRLPSESDETYGGKFFDANSDGYLDLYYANFGQPNRLLINQNGSGTFVEATPGIMPAWSGFSRGVAIGDFNNDNRVDLYVTEEQAQNRIIFSRSFDTSGDLPVAFDLVFPVNADTVNSTEVTFVWKNSTSPDTNDVLRYDFVLSLDSLFSFNSTVEGFPKENLSDTTLTVTGLNDRTRYWWKVFVHGRSGYPISSLQSHSFLLDTSHQGAGPEFYVLVSRNPAFAGHITVYIVSSEPLRSDPVVKFNLDQVPVVRVGTNDIWRAHYVTRNSFLLSITGENRSGRSGEYTKTFASVSLLASAGPGQQAPTPDRMAWVTLGPGSSAGAVRLVTSVNEQVTNAKIKEQLNRLDPFGGLDVNLVVGTDSYTFTLEEGSLTGEVTVNIRSRGNEDGPQAIYLLTEYGWQELDTRFDAGASVYSAGTDELGTFALRPAAGGPGLPKAGEFGLGQNSPNPFNPSTTIVYAIPGDTPLAGFSIKVYNLRGALVKVLVEGSVTPGRHSVQWDGRSVDGRDLPSGVYFYRMAAPGRTITRKMVLLR